MSILMLSYSETDSKVAETIAAVLQEDGIDCIMSPKTNDWADTGSDEFDHVLRDCLSYMPILSATSLLSQWLPYEVGYAAGLEKHAVCYVASPEAQVPRYVTCHELLRSIADLRRHLAECGHARVLREAAQGGP
jgi:hypothetical protein